MDATSLSTGTAALLLCWLGLCLDLGQTQMDCTGVDCPPLHNCIESVLQTGACCETCNQTGCACEGYQYYDCIQAGFSNGKVPEGESYFVDFGSTECSCPLGGGRIGCHFILCPDIPPNCIEIVQPEDGCTQCERIGCFHSSGTYDAGQYFQLDQCNVCQCPLEGGSLTCGPIPGCDLSEVNDPTWRTEVEHNSQLRDVGSDHNNQQQTQTGPSSRPAAGNTLNTPAPPRSGTEDYNTVLETTSPTSPDLDQEPSSTTEPPTLPGTVPAPVSSHRDINHDEGDAQQTQDPIRSSGVKNPQDADPTPGGAEVKITTPSTTTATRTVTTANRGPRPGIRDDTAGPGPFVDPAVTTRPDPVDRFSGHHKQNKDHTENQSVHHPTVQPSPVHRTSVETSENPEQPQTRLDHRPQDLEEVSDVSAKDLMKTCCETGQRWASVNGHCRNMEPPTKDRHAICWTAQQQCCLGSLREQQCEAGMTAARGGRTCEEDTADSCGTDSYKECCGCCSLGLQIGREGERCVAPQSLGYHCRHVFLNCCREEEKQEEEMAESQGSWHSVQERPTQDYSAPPKKVSDSPYPKEALSIGNDSDGENAAEGPVEVEDVDECLIYQDNICHHRCVNTPGSFRCECFPGYVLQDAFTCVQETVEEENGLKEDAGAAFIPLSEDTTQVNPCEGNGPCEQQCTPVDGRPQCFCSPGFSLRSDGRSCEDINECLSLHACHLDERCVNTVGSFICQRPITCPTGYQINNDMCEDIDECVQRNHNCDFGSECVNSQGSFRCLPKTRCSAGYTLDTHGNCLDIDECVTLTQPCSPGFNCINTAGSFMCQRKIMCSRGYHASPDRSTCVDVDECQSNLHHCGEGQLCHNLPGSYRCECQTGYQYDSFKRTCVDINECWRYQSRLCAQTCENTPGSYQCSCTPGFRIASDGKSCEDVNECLANPCSQECANIYGSYQCYCRQGYFLREDGHTCDDIDECSQSIGHLCTYKCVNVPGSYQCKCPDYGYTLSPNGRSCRDIDECTTGAHNCSLSDTCYNIQGGYRCLSLICPPNYRRVSDTRCERISCPDYVGCQNSPMRITYYYLSFQSNIIIPAQIFRIGPSPAYSGDNVIVSITQGNEENYFSTRKLNAYTGAVYLNRQVEGPRDFLLHVEMKLWRQGTFTTFQAKIYVFITANLL